MKILDIYLAFQVTFMQMISDSLMNHSFESVNQVIQLTEPVLGNKSDQMQVISLK